jgi:uncharacterized protein (DUF1330 family)
VSPKGYLIAEAKVHDAAAFALYVRQAQAAVERYGGRFIVQGGRTEVLEGHWSPPQRMVIIEFDSLEQTKVFYRSAEYQAACALRKNAADMNMLVISGIDNLV